MKVLLFSGVRYPHVTKEKYFRFLCFLKISSDFLFIYVCSGKESSPYTCSHLCSADGVVVFSCSVPLWRNQTQSASQEKTGLSNKQKVIYEYRGPSERKRRRLTNKCPAFQKNGLIYLLFHLNFQINQVKKKRVCDGVYHNTTKTEITSTGQSQYPLTSNPELSITMVT